MILSYLEAERLFVAHSTYDERALPKDAGFRWNPAARHWETTDSARAERLKDYADEIASRWLQTREARAPVEETPPDIPCPPGLAYLPYQLHGIAHMLARPDSLCADEMGLGKTVQAIGVVNATPNIARVLIICPASLRINWRREWQRWCVHDIRPLIVTDTWYPGIANAGTLFASPLAIIISYQGAIKHRAQIEKVPWDILVADEAHALKTASTKQTKAVLGGLPTGEGKTKWPAIAAKRRIFMSGTPLVNRPAELWPLLRVIDRQGAGADREDYWKRYVWLPEIPPTIYGTRRQAWLTAATNHRRKELHSRLTSSIMVRRLKADVLKDLPNKRRQIILVEPQNVRRLLEAENAVLAAKRAELAELKHEHAVQKLNAFRGAALAEISRIRHETALAKAPCVVEHLLDVLDEAEKVVVFHHHHDVGDMIAAALPKVTVQFDGRVDQKERDERVARFQTDRTARVFVGSIRAAGLGLTLTAASVVLFAELDWTPAAMVQAEDRLHRIGQKDSVLVHHLVIDGSIDQKMAQILIEKQTMIDAIVDGKTSATGNQSILEEILK